MKKKTRIILIVMIIILIIAPVILIKHASDTKAVIEVKRSENAKKIKDKKLQLKNHVGYIEIKDKTTPLLVDNWYTSKDQASKNDSFNNSLDHGAVIDINNGVIPGKAGNVIISAHDYPFFNNLDNLVSGDVIKITYKDKLYKYVIKEKHEIGLDQPSSIFFENDKKGLVLFTCKAEGVFDLLNPSKRLVFYGELI